MSVQGFGKAAKASCGEGTTAQVASDEDVCGAGFTLTIHCLSLSQCPGLDATWTGRMFRLPFLLWSDTALLPPLIFPFHTHFGDFPHFRVQFLASRPFP